MNTYHDCIPCFLQQALNAARLVTADETIHEQVIRIVLREVADMDLGLPPPAMGKKIYRLIREVSGSEDPYRQIKETYNQFALGLYPEFHAKIAGASNPLETAVRLAIAGNIIDFGVHSQIDPSLVYKTINAALSQELSGNFNGFAQDVRSARKILYLGDNAGEIVFDRLLIEHLPHEKITFAVRGGPVINDATMADAEAVGLTKLVNVIDNGSDAPGTLVEECSTTFKRSLAEADLVIAKGQGNYESLSELNQNIYFIFKVKCRVVAAHIGLETGSLAVKKNIKTSA
jgi:damage-control phosphatase, subfamily I